MSFRILFADDSMTAQNMGKKILTDAGYDVVAVSNGAAAVKKIAEHKPDIIILDIYMPGYSGLEVCDKVRSSVDTLKTPVLLTVGKMEPYKPEDANRVRADGVIIKPFEASDLLAVIKKLEERVVPRTMAMAQDTVLLERPPEFAEFDPPTANDVEMNAGRASAVQGTVDVPDNMATTAAFSDMLGTDPSYSLDPLPVPQSVSVVEPEILPEPPAEFEAPAAPSVDSAAPMRSESAEAWPPAPKPAPPVQAETSLESPIEFKPTPVPVVEPVSTKSAENGNGVAEWPAVIPVTSAPSTDEGMGHTVEAAVEAGFAVPEPQPATSHTEPELSAVSPETQAQPAELEKSVEPARHEISSQESTVSAAEAHRFIDPGLAIDVVGFDHASARVEADAATSEPHVAVPEAQQVEAETSKASVAEEPKRTEVAAEAPATEDDFEARVAAAMSIYDTAAEEKIDEEPLQAAEAQPVATEVASESAPPVVVEDVTPSFEYSPPVNAPKPIDFSEPPFVTGRQFNESPVNPEPMLVTTEATMVIPVYLEPPVEPKQEEPAATAVPQAQPVAAEEPAPAVEQSIEARIEAAIPVVTAAATKADVGADTQMITAVVDRILERLKPQMIEEISRELKTKKTT